MATRLWTIWFLSAAFIASAPVTSFAQASDKEKVLALSRKIDHLISVRQREAGVTPEPRADDSTYFRRLNLDLAGRIPTLTDHRDFLDNDDPAKRWEWVDKFLSSDPDINGARPGEKTSPFARHMASLLRTSILGSNLQQQFAGLAPSFELWLQERLQENMPYDRLVHEILTTRANVQGMQFRGGAGMTASPAAFYFINENKPENLAAATTRNFLGVKLECAQCHAHPFAKWSRDQFWEFAAFFAGLPPPNFGNGIQQAQNLNNGTRSIKIPGTDKVVKAKFLTGKEPIWKESMAATTMLADWVTAADNPYFARATVDQVWSTFFGVSLLEPIMEPNDDSPITYPELLDEMARQFVEQKFDLKFLVKAIVHTEAYQRASTGAASASKEDYNLYIRMPVRGLTPEQLFDSVVEATAPKDGNVNTPSLFQPFNNQPASPRAQFLNKFPHQERGHETQTSILQALFMMNGKFLAERVQPSNNGDFDSLLRSRTEAITNAVNVLHLWNLGRLPTPEEAAPLVRHYTTAKRVESLYLWVLARLPRPEETERLVRYVNAGGATGDERRAMSDIYWALLNSAEFMLNH